MRLYLRLAWRNIWRHRRRTVIIAVAIGGTMALMMWYDGLVGGFNEAIYGNAIRVLGGNIQIHAAGYGAEVDQLPLLPLANDQALAQAAQAQPQVLAAARRINTGGMATTREGAFGVTIVGVEPDQELPVSLVAQKVSAGRYLATDDQDMVYIGQGLATAMDVTVGDRFTLAGRAIHEQMRSRTMTVAGIYDIGMPDIEKRTIYITLGEAQDLYGLSGQVTEIAISLKQVGEEPAVMNALRPSLAGSEIVSWQTSFPELEQALATKGGAMNVFSVIIMFIVGIGILNLLLMAIYERTREIGILGALGLKPSQISILFVLEGVLMGLVGVAVGMALGLLINGVLGKVGLDFSAFSSISSYTALISGKVYSTWGVDKLLQRTLTVLIITTLATLYPAREAALREPAEALHYV
ncbi:MAG: FtsX-like permease family protein [Anaerolineae bacterium]|jgi:ABC-type lipoprotein release transport system permease subunit